VLSAASTSARRPSVLIADCQISLGMGQANVRRWINDLMPLVTDDADPLGTEDLASMRTTARRELVRGASR
jgi:hypothetical protein